MDFPRRHVIFYSFDPESPTFFEESAYSARSSAGRSIRSQEIIQQEMKECK
jgi:hypothetical protein